MGKRLILVLAFALVAGLTCAAYAEVQNVRVSGDITAMGVLRDDFDLRKPTQINNVGGGIANTANAGYTYSDKEADLLSITRLRVDADLTDNVMATVRLLNERNWNGESVAGVAENNRNIGLATANAASTESQIDLDLAYVTVKEFFYSPLSVKVGRQELHFGNDWIVGDPDTNMVATKSSLAEGDLSARKSFDAIRATLDYNPVVVDLVYAKLAENNTVLNDDTTLTGLNAKYDMRRDTALEGFFFSKIKGRDALSPMHADGTTRATWDNLGGDSGPTNKFKDKADEVYTVGGRVVNSSVKNMTVDLSAAYQFGTYNPKYDVNAGYTNVSSEHANTVNRRAWGAELISSYDLSGVSMLEKYSPLVKGAYIYLSGDTNDRKDSGTANKKYAGWDAMYENQTVGHILNAIMGFTNCQLGGLSFQAKPVSDLTAKLDYAAAWFNKRYAPGRQVILSGVEGARLFTMDKTPFIGQEVDLTLTYDYTEDVQFGLLGGVFMPSKALNLKDNAQGTTKTNAVEVIGSMKVTF
jgi:hypothetical protein